MFHKHTFIEAKDETTYCTGCGKAGRCAHVFEIQSEVNIREGEKTVGRMYVQKCGKCGKLVNYKIYV